MTSLTLGSLRRERSSTLRALRPCCINDLWLRILLPVPAGREREAKPQRLRYWQVMRDQLHGCMMILALSRRNRQLIGNRNVLDLLPTYRTIFLTQFLGVLREKPQTLGLIRLEFERWEDKIAVAIETLVLTTVSKGKAEEETIKSPWAGRQEMAFPA